MTIEFRLARSKTELEAVFRMRYQVYVEEMGRKQEYADHSKKTIRDPLDETGYIVAAFDGGEVVGTQRINLSINSVLGDYECFYQMKRFGRYHPTQTSVSTRLMVLASHRNTAVPIKLAIECYKIGVKSGVRFDFMDCNDHLVGYFQRLGFRRVFGQFKHPEYGIVNPMVLASRDVAYLAKCRSPFKKFAPFCEDEDEGSVELIRSLAIEYAHQQKPLLTTEAAK